jgi:hypothetical protein
MRVTNGRFWVIRLWDNAIVLEQIADHVPLTTVADKVMDKLVFEWEVSMPH